MAVPCFVHSGAGGFGRTTLCVYCIEIFAISFTQIVPAAALFLSDKSRRCTVSSRIGIWPHLAELKIPEVTYHWSMLSTDFSVAYNFIISLPNFFELVHGDTPN